MPEPIPLDPPPGDPDALDDLVRQVAGAVFCLGVLESSLRGPAGAVPGWVGRDATAATVRVDTVTAVAREGSGALWTAAGRLAIHRDRLMEARDRIRALVAQQDEDYRAAWGRLAAMPDVVTALRTASPAAVGVVEDFVAAEALRRREHVVLLADVAADATATGRVLAACSAVVGGTGRSGDAGRAVAYLAVALPEWGAVELAVRGRTLAETLLGPVSPTDRDALAREAAAYADSPEFAEALLTGLGPDGVRQTLVTLGDGGLPWNSALAALLASALGAASRSGRAVDPVGDVLDARYVDADDSSTNADVLALGMGAVLAAGLAGRPGGPAPETVTAWGRQLLDRERVQADGLVGRRAIDRANTPSDVMVPVDPLALVAETLARAEDPAGAAAFLGAPGVWDGLLARAWDDGAASVAGLVERAADDPGPAGQAAVQAGLTALGAGLEDGHPDGWTVDRATAAGVAPALGAALAGHVEVAVEALWVGVSGPGDASSTAALRGLGLVTLDRGAAAAVGECLFDWARAEIAAGAAIDPAAPAPVVAVPSAYLATRQYGLELNYALDGYEAQAAAQRRALGWDLTLGQLGNLPGIAGDVGGLLEGYAAIALDMDGTWDNGTGPGLVFDAGVAADAGLAELRPPATADAGEVVRQARVAFDRTAAALGGPLPPESPEADLWAPLLDLIEPGPDDVRRPVVPGVRPRPSG